MLRDVFYYGQKPNVHPREKFAVDLADARQKATTEHFWIINEHCDYRNFDWDFDFDFLPDEDVWAQEHNNVWPSQHQKDSGTWLCAKEHSDVIIYRNDVDPVKRINTINSCWHVLQNIDNNKWDFSWHPDPTEPPYIYVWGNQWHSGQIMPTIEYHMPNATERKYMISPVAILNSEKDKFEIFDDIEHFDFSWVPNPTSPPYIYAWGNQWNKVEDRISIQYVVPGATEYKYMHDKLKRKPCLENWHIPNNLNASGFDFSWEPNPHEPPYIYEFGTQHQKTGGPQFIVSGATEKKYIDFQKVKTLPSMDNWVVPNNIDVTEFDFSWHPDSTDPAYIYQFGTQWALSGGPKYIVSGATELKYMDTMVAKALPNRENWIIPPHINSETFDFSWHPYAEDEPYIYQFGTQHQKTGGPKYVTPGTTIRSPVSYIDTRIIKAERLPNKKNFAILNNLKIKDFDFSWHPDETEEPYIYVFGNNHYPAEIMPTIEYTVPGAKQVKYINNVIATLDVDMTNWEVPDNIDVSNFDFSWKPNPKDPAFIYQFGTQWQRSGGPRYVIPDAKDIKYVDTQKAVALPTTKYWEVPENLDIAEFDFSWHPDSADKPFIYQFGTQWALSGGPKYIMPGAKEVKYIEDPIAKAAPNKQNWIIPDDIDVDSFDFSWHPYAEDEPFIYQFGTQHQKTGGPKYMAPGADESSFTKYIDTRILKAKKLPNKENFNILNNFEVVDFDYSWHPDETEQPYIYVFGNEWNNGVLEPTVEYRVPKAKQIKYIDNVVAKLAPDKSKFELIEDIESFDYSWRPNPTDPPYIYVFGNTQYPGTVMPTVKYITPGATQEKFIDNVRAKLAQKPELFINKKNIKNFDYSWRPDPHSPPYIYVFGNQWYNAEKDSTIEYHEENAIARKYINDVVATVGPDMTNWEIPEGCNVLGFDFSWYPDPHSPAYIYQFGTLLNDVHLKDGPRYVTPKNNGEIVYLENKMLNGVSDYPKYYIKTTLEDLINEHPEEIFWALRENINYTTFDFTWKPTKEQAFNIIAFGSPDSETTQTYFVVAKLWFEGHRGIEFIENKKLEETNLAEIFVKPEMFFVDRGNSEANERFNQLKAKYTTVQKTRYLNSWVDTINRCINRSSTTLCWILDSQLDYSNFDFNYYPNPWQMNMVHVFGTQYNHWGTTFLVNRDTFSNDTKWVKIIEHLSNLNFLKDKRAIATNVLYDIVLVDHGNSETSNIEKFLKEKVPYRNVTTVKFVDSYLETFKKHIKSLPEKKEHYLWVCSSVCDYSDFDFKYICDPFAKDQLHVFPSQTQKFGDTFLIDVNKTKELIDTLKELDDYKKINYNNFQRVPRLKAPVVVTGDSNVDVANIDFDFPYCIAVTEDNKDIQAVDTEPMSLWSEDKRNIIVTSTGGTRIIVPKDVKNHVKEQLYDYPYIKTNSRLVDSNPLDIVFLSNGEKCADNNYEHLLKMTYGLKNRVVRIDGVNGRVQAYHAALEASNTPWAFTVFAKLKVSAKFDWNWQPDRLQIPKHYIFHAKNPVNGLEYGHQGMIAYNKKLTLANNGFGLDFTLDDPHETVQILSGVANYNTDEFSTWRTAFREVIKLRVDSSELAQERMKLWLSEGKGQFADFSQKGAQDALDYYKQVRGDPDELKKSYEWKWLKQKFSKLNKNNR